jgi:D-threo-aldose 1-dehydrogenase
MTTLKRRKVGTTSLEVTELGLGGAPMGGFRATIPDAEAMKLTDAAYEAGIRYFDTSPFYGYGRSELRMGAALRERPRSEYVLSTKIGRILHAMKPGESPPADFATTACLALRRCSTIRTTASCARSSIRI